MEIELDVSQIKQAPQVTNGSWRAPRHVFFGKKGADGQMEDEPVYVHQQYPKMIYKIVAEKLSAIIVDTSEEFGIKAAEGWKESPAEFGIVTAPSFEQVQKIQAKIDAQVLDQQAETSQEIRRGPGRPPKGA